MKRSTFNYIKDILKDYPNTERYIKERMEELEIPYRESDLNSGIKSNMQSDQMTDLMVTLEQDRRLSALERNKRVVEENLKSCDADTRKIIEELYMKRYPRYTMDGLVQNKILNVSRSQAFKLRDRFFENIANDLNI